jgi:hypothetical protein
MLKAVMLHFNQDVKPSQTRLKQTAMGPANCVCYSWDGLCSKHGFGTKKMENFCLLYIREFVIIKFVLTEFDCSASMINEQVKIFVADLPPCFPG